MKINFTKFLKTLDLNLSQLNLTLILLLQIFTEGGRWMLALKRPSKKPWWSWIGCLQMIKLCLDNSQFPLKPWLPTTWIEYTAWPIKVLQAILKNDIIAWYKKLYVIRKKIYYKGCADFEFMTKILLFCGFFLFAFANITFTLQKRIWYIKKMS